MKKDRRKFENPTKFLDKYVQNKVKCKCGKTVEFWTSNKKVVCDWCGNYVFRTKKDEYDYRMKGLLK